MVDPYQEKIVKGKKFRFLILTACTWLSGLIFSLCLFNWFLVIIGAFVTAFTISRLYSIFLDEVE